MTCKFAASCVTSRSLDAAERVGASTHDVMHDVTLDVTRDATLDVTRDATLDLT